MLTQKNLFTEIVLKQVLLMSFTLCKDNNITLYA